MAAAHQRHGEQRSSDSCNAKYAVHERERGGPKTLPLASEVKPHKRGLSPFFSRLRRGRRS
jgi:hypothetical protein